MDKKSSEPADFFESENEILDYLNVWLGDGSPGEIARALSDVARSQGISEISPKPGLQPEPLYPALSPDGNPTLESFLAVLHALGLTLSIRKIAP